MLKYKNKYQNRFKEVIVNGDRNIIERSENNNNRQRLFIIYYILLIFINLYIYINLIIICIVLELVYFLLNINDFN